MHNEFDDPVLKAAVMRAWQNESAPPQLRARIERAIATEAAKTATRAKMQWRNSPLVGIAAAAMILISAALLFNFYQSSEPAMARTLPNDIATEMTDAHDAAMARSSHHHLAGVPQNDLEKIRQSLREKLGHPVLVASLGSDWKFEGVLVFTRGSETVSLISVSIAGRAYAPEDGTDYNQTFNGHPMAGVTYGEAVHCVIGSTNSNLDEKVLIKLRNRVRKLVAADLPAGAAGGCGTRAFAGL